MLLFGVWVLVYLDLIEGGISQRFCGQTLSSVEYVECEMYKAEFL